MPLNSTTVEINCKLKENVEPFFELSLDGINTPLSFFNRREFLNDQGVFELPSLESPGEPPTLRLLINDTERNNQTVVKCNGIEESRQTTLFVYGK